ncbi:MAG: lipid-binding SYLF domain-containing protein [Thermovirgaceae bacterium]|jgi:lipid-binding SYLF domain-containing protein|nr:lipid-binding SYLF domain-containing protein [Synergistales bacterium]MDY0178324.1 lipid-binding SYLF domain-containing protein [Synergistaceae bacterium]HRW87122.1 lipid-binding SYLF domain-containing protein [Thermovirgaceae bacterium]MDD3830294.1 lipid-binding SYLF domain-containing protein [Synergistales bacterium]MDD4022573.1 lipid-binding SYLF domain-containing protein [Synergistales bacterium]
MKRSVYKRVVSSLVTLSLLLLLAAPVLAATANERITSSVHVVRDMSKEDDVGAMADLVKSAKGVVIIPNYVKAALGIGGAHGEGLVLRRDPATNTWFGPSFLSVTGASIGFQIGVQSTALLLVVTNQKGMDHFYGDKFKLGADVDIAAGPVGRSAGAATDVNLQASIYSYSISKGLFAGLSLSGAMMTTDHDTNSSYWGTSINSRDILQKKASAASIQPLLSALNDLIRRSGQ